MRVASAFRSVPSGRSMRLRLKLTTGLLVPAKIALPAQWPTAPPRENREDDAEPPFDELAPRQSDALVDRPRMLQSRPRRPAPRPDSSGLWALPLAMLQLTPARPLRRSSPSP